MLTQSELKKVLKYDPDSGLFTRVRGGGREKMVGTIHSHGYLRIKIKGKPYYAHRLAWLYINGDFPKNKIDHINHNKLDNRIVNLRDVTASENQKNLGLRKNSVTGITGVSCITKTGSYRSRIEVNGIDVRLYCGKDFFEACCHRRSAENKYGFHENHGMTSVGIVV